MPKGYYPRKSAAERIENGSVPCPISGCWIWEKAVSGGYGTVTIDGEQVAAHRLSYKTFKGEIPAGMLVCHKCDNPLCVNPAHLWLGTWGDNAADMARKGRASMARAKLTAEQVRELRRMADGGVRTRALVGRYGICESSVRRIVRREKWSNL